MLLSPYETKKLLCVERAGKESLTLNLYNANAHLEYRDW